MLVWEAPAKSYGEVIRYELTYKVNDGELITAVVTNTTFTFPDIPLGAIISDLYITAYSKAGAGDRIILPDVMAPEQGEYSNTHFWDLASCE